VPDVLTTRELFYLQYSDCHFLYFLPTSVVSDVLKLCQQSYGVRIEGVDVEGIIDSLEDVFCHVHLHTCLPY